MLSIIVPVYNVEKYLNRCVESLLAQSYRDLEVLLIDDGSTDNSPSICDQWAEKDARVRVFHQQNSGLSGARNAGLLNIHGEWVTFVDSDDYVNPQCYEKALATLDNTQGDVCMFGVSCESDSGELFGEERFEQNKIYPLKELFHSIILPLKTASWNKIFKKKIIENISFPDGLIHGEDLIYFIRLLQDDTKVVSCDYIGYRYIKRTNSITTASFNKHSNDEVICKDLACALVKEKFPEYYDQSSIWSFNARLNIVRKIEKSKDLKYLKNDYMKWLTEYYKNHSHWISLKNRIIFNFVKYNIYGFLKRFIG